MARFLSGQAAWPGPAAGARAPGRVHPARTRPHHHPADGEITTTPSGDTRYVTRYNGGVKYTKVCEYDGIPFEATREHARFCSGKCRIAWHRAHTAPGQDQRPNAVHTDTNAVGGLPNAVTAHADALQWLANRKPGTANRHHLRPALRGRHTRPRPGRRRRRISIRPAVLHPADHVTAAPARSAPAAS